MKFSPSTPSEHLMLLAHAEMAFQVFFFFFFFFFLKVSVAIVFFVGVFVMTKT